MVLVLLVPAVVLVMFAVVGGLAVLLVLLVSAIIGLPRAAPTRARSVRHITLLAMTSRCKYHTMSELEVNSDENRQPFYTGKCCAEKTIAP